MFLKQASASAIVSIIQTLTVKKITAIIRTSFQLQLNQIEFEQAFSFKI